MILGEETNAIKAVDAGFGQSERALVDIGRIEQRTALQTLLAEHNDERVELLAAAAAGNPYFQRRVGSQMRRHRLADGAKVRGIAKHFADLNGQIAHQPGEHPRIMQQAILHRRKTSEAELLSR